MGSSEVTIDGHLLRMVSVSGWRTADDRFNFYPCRKGWEAHAHATADIELLTDAGIFRVPVELSLKELHQTCMGLSGCSGRLKRPPAKYLIDGTPLTIGRHDRQWILKLRPNAGSLAWLFVYEALMDERFQTRRQLLEAVVDLVAKYAEKFAYVTLPPAMDVDGVSA